MLSRYPVTSRVFVASCLSVVMALAAAAQTPVLPQKFETAQQANDRLQELALSSEITTGDYRIGAGDLISVEVFEVPELTRDVRVSQSGFITLPLLPMRIQVNGLTSLQVEQKITEILQAKGLVSNPEVTVALKEQHSQPITIIGSVRQPKVIQSIRPVSLVEALSDAGGIADDAGNVVLITRKDPEPEHIGVRNRWNRRARPCARPIRGATDDFRESR